MPSEPREDELSERFISEPVILDQAIIKAIKFEAFEGSQLQAGKRENKRTFVCGEHFY